MLPAGVGDGQVATGYQHRPKLITAMDDLPLPTAYLKWYDIHYLDASIPAEVRREARDFIGAEVAAGRLPIDGDLGFVMFHKSGSSVYIIMICTWRNSNEMWKTAYFKDVRDGGAYLLEEQATHRGALCVWECGAVAHEHRAWGRYLYSARDDAAKLAYLRDRFSGTASQPDGSAPEA